MNLEHFLYPDIFVWITLTPTTWLGVITAPLSPQLVSIADINKYDEPPIVQDIGVKDGDITAVNPLLPDVVLEQMSPPYRETPVLCPITTFDSLNIGYC